MNKRKLMEDFSIDAKEEVEKRVNKYKVELVKEAKHVAKRENEGADKAISKSSVIRADRFMKQHANKKTLLQKLFIAAEQIILMVIGFIVNWLNFKDMFHLSIFVFLLVVAIFIILYNAMKED